MTKIYIDTNVIVYQVEGNLEAQKLATAAVLQWLPEDGQLVTSEITLAECLIGAMRRANQALADQYRHILLDGHIFQLAPVNRGILEAAARLGAQHRLKLIDAIHMATAKAAGCDMFITNDKGIRAGADLRVVHLGM